jgi:hypothetical protein
MAAVFVRGRDALGRFLPYSHVSKRDAERASRLRTEASFITRRERVAELWPTMSIRDIACELDCAASAVLRDANLLGLGSRPISRQP